MSTIDILLSKSIDELAMPEKEVEITRLSQKYGEKIIFKIKGLTNEQFKHSKNSCYKTVKGKREFDEDKFQCLLIAEGTVEPNLKDGRLREQYKAATNTEVVDKLLNDLEKTMLAEDILRLTGMGENAVKDVEEIKN